MPRAHRCRRRKARTVAWEWADAMGDRMPCLSPVKTWSWYGFAARTMVSSSREVWVKRTFSSFIPWMMSSRLGLERNTTGQLVNMATRKQTERQPLASQNYSKLTKKGVAMRKGITDKVGVAPKWVWFMTKWAGIHWVGKRIGQCTTQSFVYSDEVAQIFLR